MNQFKEIPKHKIKYSEMLQMIKDTGWRVLPLWAYNECGYDEKVLGIRHDIDVDYGIAKKMALYEFFRNVQSTYFVLTMHPEYFRLGAVLANYFAQLNHEVGIHLDVMSILIQTPVNVHEHLCNALVGLLQNGIVVKGSAAHGSAPAIQLKLPGAEYFYDYCAKEYQIKLQDAIGQERVLSMGVHFLAEYGLTYEATVMPKKNYISDSNGIIRINGTEYTRKQAKDALYEFLSTGSGKTIALFHPIYWNLERE
jgi:hypothetical protein